MPTTECTVYAWASREVGYAIREPWSASSHEKQLLRTAPSNGRKPQIKGSFEMPKHVLCFFGQHRDSFPGRSNAPILYGLVTPRSRTEGRPLLTTLEKPVLHFENLFCIINAVEQMLCWKSAITTLSCNWHLQNFGGKTLLEPISLMRNMRHVKSRLVSHHLVFPFVRLSHCLCQMMTDVRMSVISCQICPTHTVCSNKNFNV